MNYQEGQILVAVGGNRRVKVTSKDGILRAEPLLKDDGMEPIPLEEWLAFLPDGAEPEQGEQR